MSVFQVHEWWAAKAETVDTQESEEFDVGCLCVANFDNDPSGSAKIATGSLNGVLRIYFPRQEGYQIDDLALEQKFEQPILQIEFGRFISSCLESMSLAILHPHELCVYLVLPASEPKTIAVNGDEEKVNKKGTSNCHFKLEKSYSHFLGEEGKHFTASNFTYGPFGGVVGKDYIAIQSMDGQLQICEQEGYTFIRQLNHVLVPGPICYLRKTDSIIVCNSQLQVDCYKYHSLATATVVTKQGIADELDKTTLIQTDWTTTVGEQITQVVPCRFCRTLNSSQVDIFLLGEHSFFCLSEQGLIRMQHKFTQGFDPMCCVTYDADERDTGTDDEFQNIIITSAQGKMLVFQNRKILWSAILNDLTGVPVAQKVSGFGGTKGFVVTLDEFGKCQITYMGTNPSPNTLKDDVSSAAHDMDYETMVGKHRELLEQIHASQEYFRSEKLKPPLEIRAVIPTNLDEISFEDNALALSEQNRFAFANSGNEKHLVQLTIRVYLDYNRSHREGYDIDNMHLSVELPPGIESDKPSYDIPSGTQYVDMSLRLVPEKRIIPNSLSLNLIISYTSNTEEPKFLCSSVNLPLCTFVQLINPFKACNHKITIDTDKDALRLPLLFSDLLKQPHVSTDFANSIRGGTANVVSLRFFSSEEQVTILASKNKGRYQIRSLSFDALYLTAAELIKRIEKHFKVNDEKVSIRYNEALPLADLFTAIDRHFKARTNKLETESELNDRSHQYRLVQKRLLCRFKDKAATSLNGLNLLLQATHEKVINAAQEFAKMQDEIHYAQISLSTTIKLIWLLSKLCFNISDNDMDNLTTYLSERVAELDGPGTNGDVSICWEEYTQEAITRLLKSSMAKPDQERERSRSSHWSQISKPIADTTRLRKRLTILFDRLSKGIRPSLSQVSSYQGQQEFKNEE